MLPRLVGETHLDGNASGSTVPAQTNPQVHRPEGIPGRMPPSRDRQTAARAPGGMEPTVPPSLGSRSLTPLVPEQVEAGALGLRPPAQVCLPSRLSLPELRRVVPRCGGSPAGDPGGPWGPGLLSQGACPQGRMLETREPTFQQSSLPLPTGASQRHEDQRRALSRDPETGLGHEVPRLETHLCSQTSPVGPAAASPRAPDHLPRLQTRFPGLSPSHWASGPAGSPHPWVLLGGLGLLSQMDTTSEDVRPPVHS